VVHERDIAQPDPPKWHAGDPSPIRCVASAVGAARKVENAEVEFRFIPRANKFAADSLRLVWYGTLGMPLVKALCHVLRNPAVDGG
jgi:hypothetical protein